MREPLPITYFLNWTEHFEAPESRLRSIKESGMDHLVLSHELLRLGMQDMKKFDAFCRAVERSGLDFVDAHAPFGNLCDLSLPLEQYRPVMIAQNKLVLNLCAAVGVKTCTIHLGNCIYEQKFPLKHYWNLAERSLAELLPEAEKCGVILNVENVANPPSQAEVILRCRKKFDTPFLGVCFDAGHAEIARSCHKSDPQSAVYKAWGWLPEEEPRWDDRVPEEIIPDAVTCHIHDNDGLHDQHMLPFTGVISWERIIALLARAPRLQCIQSEAKLQMHGNTFREAVLTFQRFSAMLEAERNKVDSAVPAN